MGKLRFAVGFVLVAAILAAAFAIRRSTRSSGQHAPAQTVAASRYADPAECATCHAEIARTYSQTGMGRSFSKLRADRPLPDVKAGTLYHKPSDRHYTMAVRDGRYFQARHQIGFGGVQDNAIELEAQYVIGSGNHARTFLHQNRQGQLVQLPVSWYQEKSFWAMSPGYDRPAHVDFRRVIDTGCMSCHNGYPRAPVRDDGTGPIFSDTLPDGIDCQRCHGPGQAHIDAINARNLDVARQSIVNPSKLNRDRQLETCMQCHLEPTSSPLPYQIRRYEHAPFSFEPGKTLADYFIYFDHDAAAKRDDKFEIAGAAYRLRKSACFEQSEMTCVTCHDPHDIPRGDDAVRHYVAVCESCHRAPHPARPPATKGAPANATCIDCHMPKRRTDDAVHVVMTDHYIQRRRPPIDLLAARSEPQSLEHGSYRGEVVPYYPRELRSSPDSDLYLALAQVQQGANVKAGIERLETAIAAHRPTRPDFYYELARAYGRVPNHDAALRWSDEALRRDPAFVPALKERSAAAMAKGQLGDAAGALEKAIAVRPRDVHALADLGNVYLQSARTDDARRVLERALAIDADLPRANNTMGLALLQQGQQEAAGRHFRAAIRAQPDLAEAQNNLGNLLASRKAYDEAAHHFAQAIRSDPAYVDAQHSYGLVLGLLGRHADAIAALQKAVMLAPDRPQARLDLADVLAAAGQIQLAEREYRAVIQNNRDPALRAAAEDALRRLRR